MALLEASGIGKNFGETKVLKDISLNLEQGEALAIIGSIPDQSAAAFCAPRFPAGWRGRQRPTWSRRSP